jgi:hypothetical protein
MQSRDGLAGQLPLVTNKVFADRQPINGYSLYIGRLDYAQGLELTGFSILGDTLD